MRLTFQIFLTLLIPFLFSCETKNDGGNPDEVIKPELSVSQQNLTFTQEGGYETITINSNTICTIKSGAFHRFKVQKRMQTK